MGLIYVTGEIGAGKSAFCDMLSALGAIVVKADSVVHEIYEQNPAVIAQINQALGDDYSSSHGINRSKLAARIFADPDAKLVVEQIVHPYVKSHLEKVILENSNQIIVFENSVLKIGNDFPTPDVVVVVSADLSIRLTRLMQRGMSQKDALQRIQNQANDKSLIREGYAVLNNSDLAALSLQADLLFKELQH